MNKYVDPVAYLSALFQDTYFTYAWVYSESKEPV